MKIVVIGGSGLIGSKLVSKLREQGHEAVAASPKSGVNSITCEGLAEALKGASVVVDVTNSPSWEDAAVMTFFETSTGNLLAYGAAAEVGGPEKFRLDELVRQFLAARKDPREVVPDPQALYYGVKLSENTLLPGDAAPLGETRFEDWLSLSASQILPTKPLTTAVAA